MQQPAVRRSGSRPGARAARAPGRASARVQSSRPGQRAGVAAAGPAGQHRHGAAVPDRAARVGQQQAARRWPRPRRRPARRPARRRPAPTARRATRRPAPSGAAAPARALPRPARRSVDSAQPVRAKRAWRWRARVRSGGTDDAHGAPPPAGKADHDAAAVALRRRASGWLRPGARGRRCGPRPASRAVAPPLAPLSVSVARSPCSCSRPGRPRRSVAALRRRAACVLPITGAPRSSRASPARRCICCNWASSAVELCRRLAQRAPGRLQWPAAQTTNSAEHASRPASDRGARGRRATASGRAAVPSTGRWRRAHRAAAPVVNRRSGS